MGIFYPLDKQCIYLLVIHRMILYLNMFLLDIESAMGLLLGNNFLRCILCIHFVPCIQSHLHRFQLGMVFEFMSMNFQGRNNLYHKAQLVQLLLLNNIAQVDMVDIQRMPRDYHKDCMYRLDMGIQ
jgi:hypothetical protein